MRHWPVPAAGLPAVADSWHDSLVHSPLSTACVFMATVRCILTSTTLVATARNTIHLRKHATVKKCAVIGPTSLTTLSKRYDQLIFLTTNHSVYQVTLQMPDDDSEVIRAAANILLAKRVQCQIMKRGQD